MLVFVSVEVGEAQRRAPRDAYRRMGGAAEFGVRGGYDFDAEVGSAGSQLRIPIIRQLLLVPSGDVFFSDGDAGADWQLNADLLARPDELGGLYVGAGAAFMREDFDGDAEEEVEVGYNLLAGMEAGALLGTRLRPFAEARWTFVDDLDPFRIVFGLNAPVR
jgi:hypothetical protein